MENKTPVPVRNSPKTNWHSAFELIFKYLPAGELAFIIGPIILFGMFTWGLSPDDPQLRQGYYSLFFVVMPAAFVLGNIFSRISWRRKLVGILDLAGGILAGLCFLWFFAKVSLVPPGAPVVYIGWNWREWLQFYLLLPLVGVKACRLGMIPNTLAGVIKNSSTTNTTFYAAIGASGIVSLQYVVDFFLGFWPWLFLFIVFWDMLASWEHLFLKEVNHMEQMRVDSKAQESTFTSGSLLKVAMPFMILVQGGFWGLMYITTMWSQTWIGLFGLAGGVATVLIVLLLKIRDGILLSHDSGIVPLITIGCLGASLLLLLTRWVQPMDVSWSIINGISLGGLLTIGIKMYAPPKRAFWGPYRLLAFIFLFILGIAGGIAYFWYDPQGEKYIPWVLFACVIIAGVFSAIYALIIRRRR